MVKKSLLIMMLLALFAPWAANAQTVTIGTGTSAQNSAPIANYYNYSMAEMIFTADEIGTIDVNTILSLGFQCTTNVSKNYGVTVYMKNIEADAFTATTDFITLSATDVVFTGTVSPTSGWTTIDLPTPFTYNRTGNLLIAVNKTSGGYDDYTSIWNYTSTSTTYKMLYGQNDSSPGVYDPTTTLSLSLNYNRPNVQLVFGAPASTPKPTGLAVSGITHNEATLSWTENGTATSWQYCLNGDEDHPVTMNTNPYTLTGLTPLTSYTVKVRSVGNNEYSDWSNEVSFNTTAQATAVGDSWSDDFEGTSCGWDLINGTLTNQWVWGTAVNNGGTHALYISNDGGNSNTYSADNTKVFAAKLLNFTEGKFIFSYDWRCKGESSWDFLRVALVPASQTLTAGTDYSTITQPSLPTGWIALDGGKLNLQETWQSVELAVNVPAGNYYLVLAWRNDTGVYDPPAAVDNVSITRMACPYDVTDLAVSNITTTGATLTWTAGEAEEWQVATKAGDGEWTILPNTYTTNSATLTGLTAATTYQVRVRAYCNANDQGTWCDPITFATECEAIDLALVDYSENFDSYTAASGFLPLCWNRINEGTNTTYNQYPYLSSYGSNSGNCLRFYAFGTTGTSDQYAILPEMTGLEGKQISLMAKAYNNGNVLKIGMMTDPDDVTTFVEIASETLTTSYQPLEYILGQGNYVAFLMEAPTSSSTTVGIYIDDIAIAEAPTCFRPTDLEFVNSTTNSATIGWTNGAEGQTAWQIAYSTDPAFNPDEVTPVDVTSNPGTINNLTAATTYYAYVRANCGNNGYSDWSYAYCMFNTECDAITISDEGWTENFNSYTAGATSTSTPSAYPNDVLPTCWQFLNRSETSGTYPQVFLSSYSSYVVSGNCLFFKSSSSTPMYAILPEFTEDIANLQLTFTYRNEGVSASNGTLIVGYMTDPTDATTFIAKHTCEQTTTLTEQEVLFTDAPARSYIAFMYQGGSANNYYLSIDNVSVNYPPTCAKPSNLEFVSSTTTSATLKWTAGGDETAWQIAYSTDPAFNPDEVTPVDVTSNPGTINNLTAATTYYAYVRANCGNDDYSDWSSAYVQFATECDVIVVDATHPFTEGFDGITSGIPVCWDNSEGTTSTESYRWNYYATGYKGHCVRFDSYNNSADNTNFLKTPVMDLPREGGNLQLSFWYKNPTGGDFSVFISTDGGDTYTTALASDLTDQSDWTNEVISLSEYAGNENVVIVFAGTSNWAYGDAYIYLDEVFVGMPFTKEIDAYDEANEKGWYLIASPLADAVNLNDVDGLTENEFRLYSFNQSADLEWEYYGGDNNPFTSLVNGQGYLYANSANVTLTFTGAPLTETEVDVDLVYDEEAYFDGWNLVGNPFAEEAYINKAAYTLPQTAQAGEPITLVAVAEGTSIQAMEGVFVFAEGAGESVTFSKTAKGKSQNLNLNLTKGQGLIDRAIVSFGEGGTLPKFQLFGDHTKVYIPQEGKDYAVVSASEMGEMPVSFKAEENGTYTLSFNADEVSFSYLHLIDNMTGMDVDLLQAPSYTFNATTTDYTSRFKLVFATGSNNDSDNFAFFSNGNWVIGNEGEATLQVVDVTGRILSSETVNGSVSKAINAAPGVYMLRLINGENVKVQKIVVK